MRRASLTGVPRNSRVDEYAVNNDVGKEMRRETGRKDEQRRESNLNYLQTHAQASQLARLIMSSALQRTDRIFPYNLNPRFIRRQIKKNRSTNK